MDPVLVALDEQLTELADLLAGLDAAQWDHPSRCDGWTVSDVVLHLAQTNEMAVGSAIDRFDEVLAGLVDGAGPPPDEPGVDAVEDGAGLMVDLARGASAEAVHERWRASAQAMRDALAARDPHDRVTWVAGELSVRTLITTRLAESWIHTGDVAVPLDIAPEPTDRLWQIARLAWRTLPYAFAGAGRELAGPVAFILRSPGGETWTFVPDDAPITTVTGDALDLCLVAARRARPEDTSLVAEGPDADTVLELVRTFA